MKQNPYVDMSIQILKVAAAASILLASFAMPNLVQVLPLMGLDDGHRKRKYCPSDVSRALLRLQSRGLVKLVHTPGGKALRTTLAGDELLARYAMSNQETPKPRRWDKKWRIVIYDINEERKWKRNLIRDRLRQWGWYRLQDSVWAFPYECEELIELLKTGYRLRHDILYFTVPGFTQDRRLREHFGFL